MGLDSLASTLMLRIYTTAPHAYTCERDKDRASRSHHNVLPLHTSCSRSPAQYLHMNIYKYVQIFWSCTPAAGSPASYHIPRLPKRGGARVKLRRRQIRLQPQLYQHLSSLSTGTAPYVYIHTHTHTHTHTTTHTHTDPCGDGDQSFINQVAQDGRTPDPKVQGFKNLWVSGGDFFDYLNGSVMKASNPRFSEFMLHCVAGNAREVEAAIAAAR